MQSLGKTPFSTYSTANLPLLGIFKTKSSFFLKNAPILLKKEKSFEQIEDSYCFSRILRQIFYNLVKKI